MSSRDRAGGGQSSFFLYQDNVEEEQSGAGAGAGASSAAVYEPRSEDQLPIIEFLYKVKERGAHGFQGGTTQDRTITDKISLHFDGTANENITREATFTQSLSDERGYEFTRTWTVFRNARVTDVPFPGVFGKMLNGVGETMYIGEYEHLLKQHLQKFRMIIESANHVLSSRDKMTANIELTRQRPQTPILQKIQSKFDEHRDLMDQIQRKRQREEDPDILAGGGSSIRRRALRRVIRHEEKKHGVRLVHLRMLYKQHAEV